ncbi:MAG: zinc ribbon domain-containing protein [Candidatus Thermoplasmatota archaeon]|jgi:hypothetical protein|nr:zinc ribbon domain-containing protein [Candidatus Thermoplasmatota archaeon]
MPISPLEGHVPRIGRKRTATRRERPPWVTWIALCLGVFFTGTGLVMLLWGLSWQSWSISPQSIGEEELQGGPIILPLGAFCLVLGIMWLFQGWTGFRRPEEGDGTRVCPNCRHRVEEDLDFCYHCLKRLQSPERDAASKVGASSEEGGKRGKLELEALNGKGRGQRK